MKKNINKLGLFMLISLFASASFIVPVLAKGGATVSWTRTTTNDDVGNTTLTDLAGYRIFYSTSSIDCTGWDAASDQTARGLTAIASVSHVDVTEANTLKDSSNTEKRGYTFNTGSLLTPGQTYHFTVVAYDTSYNYSKCINDSGANKTQSKLIYHTGNIKASPSSGPVGLSDLSILAGDFNRTAWCRIAATPHPSDLNGDCTVNLSDLNIFAGEWGL